MGTVGLEGGCCGRHGGALVRLPKRTGARGGRAVATLAMKIFFFRIWPAFPGNHFLDS